MQVMIEVDSESLAESLMEMRQPEAKEMILAWDRQFADVEFTESLIMALCESLSADMQADERAAFVESIRTAINSKEEPK